MIRPAFEDFMDRLADHIVLHKLALVDISVLGDIDTVAVLKIKDKYEC
jgi:hypothetical protein